MSSWTAILLAALLLLLRALATAADAALGRISLERAKELSNTGRRGLALFQLKSAAEDSAAALRALLIFSLVFAASLAAYAGAELPAWTGHLGASARIVGPLLAGLVTAVLATGIDVVSRALGVAGSEQYALRVARLVRACSRLLSPILRSSAAALELLLTPFGAKVRFAAPVPPLEEIERFLAEEAGRRIDQKAPALIHSIFELSEKSARDVMVPRMEIVAVEIGTTPEELIRILAEEGHSRMPVYRGDIDHIVGILHARDLVPLVTHPELIVLQDLLRPAAFVPWAKPIGDLLREMQKQRIHMAMVTDEYGGFMGLVTLEDILEEIVGEIGDEFDEERAGNVEPLPDGTFLVRGATPLEELNRAFAVEMPEGDYETLSGFLNALAGAIPEVGDKFFFSGLQFTVTDRSPKLVRRVRVARLKKPAVQPAGAGPAPS